MPPQIFSYEIRRIKIFNNINHHLRFNQVPPSAKKVNPIAYGYISEQFFR